MQVINLTDQPVTIVNERGLKLKTFLPSGPVASCDVKVIQQDIVGGVPISVNAYGQVRNLPVPDDNLEMLYIVNEYVAEAVKSSRFDILVPHDLVRTEAGETAYRGLLLK